MSTYRTTKSKTIDKAKALELAKSFRDLHSEADCEESAECHTTAERLRNEAHDCEHDLNKAGYDLRVLLKELETSRR